MKTALIALCIAALLIGWQIRTEIVSHYRIEKNYMHMWELADKSSTIPAKQKYIAEFVAALENGYAKGDFASYNAVWMKTPNNSFVANLGALKSLSDRLVEIQDMNPSSFEYNTAIQQITAQEQGESKAMLSVFIGCYNLASYPLIWKWIGGTLLAVELVVILFASLRLER